MNKNTVEDHAKNIIYRQAIQISALSTALDAVSKELASANTELETLRPKPAITKPKEPEVPSTTGESTTGEQG